MRYLRNEHREQRLDEVTLALSAQMLVVSGLEAERDAALKRCDEAVSSGRAAEVFGRMSAALGGPADFVDRYSEYLPKANVTRPVHADGYLTEVNARAVGNAIIALGGGRRRVGEALDLSVGFTDIASIGTLLDKETPLAIVHAATEDDAIQVEQLLLDACEVGEKAPIKRPVVAEIISGKT